MNFSFLNPWIWLGAFAIAAPLWLHLRRKTPADLIRFSALRFLDDQPEPRQSPRQLRDALLFALRALAVLLLVAAFAWPFLRDPNEILIKESRVYVLDNTLSHQAAGGFARDRDRLAAALAGVGRETQIAVVELTANPRLVVGFGDDVPTARRKLNELTVSHQRGSYLAAFRLANAQLANSLGERKRLILLGDNQENQWTEHSGAVPFIKDVEVELPKIATTNAPNISLAEARAQRVFLGDKSVVNFSVQLNHRGPAASAMVTLRTNGHELFRKPVALANQPESLLVQAQWESDPAQAVRGDISVEGAPDALAGDNRAFFAVPAVREGKVALLAQSPFLRLALSPEIMRGQWEAHVLEPARVADELAANRDADVLCIESNYLQASAARELLSRYLSNGRGVLLAVNRITPLVTGFLRDLGFEVLPPDKEAVEPKRLQYIFSNHPIFHPFRSPEYGNLTEVTVTRPVRLKASQAAPLVYSERGEAVFFQSIRPAGRLFVTAFGFDREQTTWPVHPTFIPFLDLCLQAARAEDPAQTAFEPGEIHALTFPAGSNVRAVSLRDGQKELLHVPVLEGKVQLRLPDLPGLYTLAWDVVPPVERILSVNPSPKEWQLNYVAHPDALASWQRAMPSVAEDMTSRNPRGLPSLTGILQQRVWWWLLLAALTALAAETAWTSWRKAKP